MADVSNTPLFSVCTLSSTIKTATEMTILKSNTSWASWKHKWTPKFFKCRVRRQNYSNWRKPRIVQVGFRRFSLGAGWLVCFSVCNKTPATTTSSLTSLYDLVSEADETLLFCSNVTYDNISKAKIGKNGVGLVLADDISFDLKSGDRFFTMNDINIFNITQDDWSQFKISTAFPVEAVVLRSRSKIPTAGKAIVVMLCSVQCCWLWCCCYES